MRSGLVNGPASHLELMWEEPRTARTFGLMAQYARLIMFDRRGTGLSDPALEPPTLEQQVWSGVDPCSDRR